MTTDFHSSIPLNALQLEINFGGPLLSGSEAHSSQDKPLMPTSYRFDKVGAGSLEAITFTKKQQKKAANGNWRNHPPGLRFDDAAYRAADAGAAMAWIAANPPELVKVMEYPDIDWQLESIHSVLLHYPTNLGSEYHELITVHGLQSAVVILSGVGGEIPNFPIPRGSRVRREEGKELTTVHELCISHKSIFTEEMKVVRIPGRRWNIATKKCRRIDGNVMEGPYLAVLLYEAESKLVTRIRLIPIFLSRNNRTFSFLRSEPERTAHQVFHEGPHPVFAPLRKQSLKLLQERYGDGKWWPGDITAYPYHPDLIVIRPKGTNPDVTEIFAVHGIKRYDASKKAKRESGKEIVKSGKSGFMAIEVDNKHRDDSIRAAIREYLASITQPMP